MDWLTEMLEDDIPDISSRDLSQEIEEINKILEELQMDNDALQMIS